MATTGTEDQWKSIHVELLGSQTRLVKGNTYTTRTIEAGSGEPLILMHGNGGSAEAFSRNIMNLAKHFHVHAIDALYNGFSSKDPLDTDDRPGHQVSAVLDFMDAEGLTWAHFEGQASGAHVAFRLGLEHPERCGKLIMSTGHQINFKRTFRPPLVPPEIGRSLTKAALDDPRPETVRPRVEWLVAAPDRATDELVDLRAKFYSMPEVQKAMRTQVPATPGRPTPRRSYNEEDCGKLQKPTLVLWGEFNPGGGPDIGVYLASLIPGAKFHLMKDSAHWPQWEHPEEHDRVVIDFLQDRL